ncbi:MAG: class I SAM-dependent methyltransferase [Limnohabitans sp.]
MPPSSHPDPCVALHGVQRSLFIPLIVRAQAAAWCPMLDPGDAHAHNMLSRSGEPPGHYPTDMPTAINILWRTCRMRDIARHFFTQHPLAHGINLGAGLTDYFQWLDNGRNHWLDVDLAPVIALRRQLLPTRPKRHTMRVYDLRTAGWWQRLQLQRRRAPLLLVCEGVLMYMQADEIQAFFREIGEHAPTGTELVCDFISPLGIGQTIAANRHPGDVTTFTWGTQHAQDLTRMHPRLQLVSEYSVAEAYGWCGSWLEALWSPLTGGPLYGLAHLRVTAHPATSAAHPR